MCRAALLSQPGGGALRCCAAAGSALHTTVHRRHAAALALCSCTALLCTNRLCCRSSPCCSHHAPLLQVQSVVPGALCPVPLAGRLRTSAADQSCRVSSDLLCCCCRYAASCLGLFALCLLQEGLARWRMQALASPPAKGDRMLTSEQSSADVGQQSSGIAAWRRVSAC